MECIQNILSGMYKSPAVRRNMTLQGTDRCSVSSQIGKGSMFWDDIEDGYRGQTMQVFVSCFKHFGLYPKNIREQLKSFQNFDSVWRKEAGTVCSWCLAERLAATLHYSFHVAWMYNTSRVATAVAELGERLKIHWCFDEKVSWLVLSRKAYLAPKANFVTYLKLLFSLISGM